MTKVPIAVFIYKRFDTTSVLFSELTKIKPCKLYVFANGPVDEYEVEACEKTRNIFDEIIWECEVVKQYRDVNIGLGNQIISGLNFLFEHEERAIILEDDCIPSTGFVPYCELLLDKYDSDEQVMHINGTNIAPNISENHPYSYFFTRFSVPSWGWATWRRAWQKFNPKCDTWQHHKMLLFMNIQQKHFRTWTDIIGNLAQTNNFWDIAWNIDIWYNRGLVISPKMNLVNNVGLNEEGTYMKVSGTKYSSLPTYENLEIKIIHPDEKMIFDKEDLYEDELCLLFNTFTIK